LFACDLLGVIEVLQTAATTHRKRGTGRLNAIGRCLQDLYNGGFIMATMALHNPRAHLLTGQGAGDEDGFAFFGARYATSFWAQAQNFKIEGFGWNGFASRHGGAV
jgi:hypothetical protein